jgi:hypothetical protein
MYPTANIQQSARVVSGTPGSGAPLVTNTRGRSCDRRDAGGDVDSRPSGFAAKIREMRADRR